MKINPREVDIFGYESPACLEMIISLMIGKFEKDSKINMALKYGTHSDYSLNKKSYEDMMNLNRL